MIEIIRTTKDRVPLRDVLPTDAKKGLNMRTLVPIQKGRQLVEQGILAAAVPAGHQSPEAVQVEEIRCDRQR